MRSRDTREEAGWTRAKGIVGDVSLYDAETGAVLMHLKGLNYAKLDADPKPDPHVFDSVQWRPDITLLTRAPASRHPSQAKAITKTGEEQVGCLDRPGCA